MLLNWPSFLKSSGVSTKFSWKDECFPLLIASSSASVTGLKPGPSYGVSYMCHGGVVGVKEADELGEGSGLSRNGLEGVGGDEGVRETRLPTGLREKEVLLGLLNIPSPSPLSSCSIGLSRVGVLGSIKLEPRKTSEPVRW